MSVKLSDVTQVMNRRTKATPTSTILSYLNVEIQNDLKNGVRKTWPEYFKKTIEIPVTPSTVQAYPLPDDFGDLVAADSNTNTNVHRGTNAPVGTAGEKNLVSIVSKVMTISIESTLETVILDYWIPFPNFNAVDAIILPDEISSVLLGPWASGADFYIFSDNRKFDRAQTAADKYKSQRVEYLAPSTLSLS